MMRRAIVPVLVAAAIVATSTEGVGAKGGPCSGESLGGRRVDAMLVGKPSVQSTKLIVHLATTPDGAVSGTLILGRGTERLEVTSWCRLWEGGEGESAHSDVVHAIGEATFSDGIRRYVRVDVTGSEGGRVRVRTKNISGGGHDSGHSSTSETTEHDDSGHGGWTALTGKGWLPLTRARIGSTEGRTPWTR